MGLLIFLQVIFDLAFIATATLLLIERSKSKTAEDPRMSRGLQLLSSKIAIIQDLMDRSETMSRQMTQLIDGKSQDLQERLEEAEVHLSKMRKATAKSEEVVRVFQDKIPHQEMIERQTAEKYSLAAKMAQKGITLEEISKQIDIPHGELELIVKINRNKSQAAQPIQSQEPITATEEPSFPAKVANSANKEAQIRPVVFKRIISGHETEIDFLK